MLFSYVILFDLFPLYKFESTECLRNSNNEMISNLNQNSSSSSSSSLIVKHDNQLRRSELILIIWMLTILCEEIREVKLRNVIFSK